MRNEAQTDTTPGRNVAAGKQGDGMHITAIRFALRYSFRLGNESGNYYLYGADGRKVDVANGLYGRHTAQQAIRMMRRHVRRNITEARAGTVGGA
jgi:hypothetical protein